MKEYLAVDHSSHLDFSILYYLYKEFKKLKVKRSKTSSFNIDEFKKCFFSSVKEGDFRIAIETMAIRQEIELDGEGMRLTQIGIQKCNKQNSAISA